MSNLCASCPVSEQAGCSDRGGNCPGQGFDARRILSVKARRFGAVQVDHGNHLSIVPDRNHQFRPAGGIAGNVSGEGVDIGDQLRRATGQGRAADALA